jgi:hypothetical protein
MNLRPFYQGLACLGADIIMPAGGGFNAFYPSHDLGYCGIHHPDGRIEIIALTPAASLHEKARIA